MLERVVGIERPPTVWNSYVQHPRLIKWNNQLANQLTRFCRQTVENDFLERAEGNRTPIFNLEN